jgi:hypothetical protein
MNFVYKHWYDALYAVVSIEKPRTDTVVLYLTDPKPLKVHVNSIEQLDIKCIAI